MHVPRFLAGEEEFSPISQSRQDGWRTEIVIRAHWIRTQRVTGKTTTHAVRVVGGCLHHPPNHAVTSIDREDRVTSRTSRVAVILTGPKKEQTTF